MSPYSISMSFPMLWPYNYTYSFNKYLLNTYLDLRLDYISFYFNPYLTQNWLVLLKNTLNMSLLGLKKIDTHYTEEEVWIL